MAGVAVLIELIKNQFSTTKGKISSIIIFLFTVFFVIHFIFSCIELGSSQMKVQMKHLKFEIFPQFAMCPLFAEQYQFAKGPECFKYNRIYHNSSVIHPTTKTITHKYRDRSFTTTCYLFNGDQTLRVGNESVSCNFLIQQKAAPYHYGDAEIIFSQSGSPDWWNFCGSGGDTLTEECPDGPNRYRLPRHTFNYITLETISFADDDDAGYAKIMKKEFKAQGKLDLPNREYKVYGHTMWEGFQTGRGANNNTETIIRWQSMDVWQYKNVSTISFWAWVSYIGGVLFLLTFLYNVIMFVVSVFLLGEAPSTTGKGEYSQIS